MQEIVQDRLKYVAKSCGLVFGDDDEPSVAMLLMAIATGDAVVFIASEDERIKMTEMTLNMPYDAVGHKAFLSLREAINTSDILYNGDV